MKERVLKILAFLVCLCFAFSTACTSVMPLGSTESEESGTENAPNQGGVVDGCKNGHPLSDWKPYGGDGLDCTDRIFYRECEICGDVVLRKGSEDFHNWKVETILPTCISEGYDFCVCLICGAEKTENTTNVTTHSWETEVVPPTCITEGYNHKVCLVCGAQEDDGHVAIVDHDFTLITYDETHHWYKCQICPEIKEKEKHTIEGNKCTVCGYLVPTKGIIYEINGDEATVTGYDGRDEDVVIGEFYNGCPVTSIRYNAFEYCDLTSVVIPKSVKTIGSLAFYRNTRLEKVYISSGVTSISSDAFSYCVGLKNIEVDSKNQVYKSINGNLYSKDGSVLYKYAPGKITSEFLIPNSVTRIAHCAFEHIGIYAGREDLLFVKPGSITSVVTPENNNVIIESSAFYECDSLKRIVIRGKGTIIEESAFSGCSSLESVVMVGKVKSIGDYAFCGTSITSINIPESVEEIGKDVFTNCKSLTSINVSENNPNYKSVNGSLYSKDGKELICYIMSGNETEISIPNTVTRLASGAFSLCVSMTKIYVPASVRSMNGSPFSDCNSLTSIEVDENNPAYKSIDGNLYSKDGTTLIKYAKGKTETEFVVPSGVTNISEVAFTYCLNLISVKLPKSLKVIDGFAFFGCNNLTYVYYEGLESDWKNILIGSNNYTITNARISYGVSY